MHILSTMLELSQQVSTAACIISSTYQKHQKYQGEINYTCRWKKCVYYGIFWTKFTSYKNKTKSHFFVLFYEWWSFLTLYVFFRQKCLQKKYSICFCPFFTDVKIISNTCRITIYSN